MTQAYTVTVQLDPDEHAKLTAEADKAGLTLQEYASGKLSGHRSGSSDAMSAAKAASHTPPSATPAGDSEPQSKSSTSGSSKK
jgi:hypothetical protein